MEDKGIWPVVFSPDGKQIASTYLPGRSRICIVDAMNGQAIGAPLDDRCIDSIMPLAFSPDGKSIAAGSRPFSIINIWDLPSGGHLLLKLCPSDELIGYLGGISDRLDANPNIFYLRTIYFGYGMLRVVRTWHPYPASIPGAKDIQLHSRPMEIAL